MGREYREAKDDVKQLHVDHITLESEDLRQTADLRATQLPTNEDVDVANEMTDQANAQVQVDPQTGQPVAQPAGPPQGNIPNPSGQATPAEATPVGPPEMPAGNPSQPAPKVV